MIIMEQTDRERIVVLEIKVESAETVAQCIGNDVKEIRKDLHKISINQSMLFGGLIVIDCLARYFIR